MQRGNLLNINVLSAVFIILLFGIPISIAGLLGKYSLEIGFQLMIYIVLAEAWNMLAGYGGLVSLGSAAFIGVGAYVFVGFFNGHVGNNLALALLAAGVVGAVFAAIVSPALLRMRGLYFTVGTLAFGEALRIIVVNAPWFGRSTGLYLNINFPTDIQLYVFAFFLMVLAEVAMSFFTQSRLSILLCAIRDDEDAAAQVGVRTVYGKTTAFCVSGFFMAAAGGLQAYNLGAVEPTGLFGMQWSINILIIVVIGGLGQRLGAIVGTFFIVILGELLAGYPATHVISTAVILILVIRYLPKGVCGFLMKSGQRILPVKQRAA